MFPIDTKNTVMQKVFDDQVKNAKIDIEIAKNKNRIDSLQADYWEKNRAENQKGALLFETEQLKKQYEREKQILAVELIDSLVFRELMYRYGSALGMTQLEVAKQFNETRIDILNKDAVFASENHYKKITDKLDNDPKKINAIFNGCKEASEKGIKSLQEKIEKEN